MNLTNEELAYMAGIVDGEGTITINSQGGIRYNRNFIPILCVYNNKRQLMDWIQERFPGPIYSRPGRKPGHSESHQWMAMGKTAVQYITLIKPYLVIKVEQAEQIVSLWKAHETYQVSNQYRTPQAYLDYALATKEVLSILNARGI